MSQSEFPIGWDDERVKRVLAHYANQSQEELATEDEEAARELAGRTMISLPEDLFPAIRQLLATHRTA